MSHLTQYNHKYVRNNFPIWTWSWLHGTRLNMELASVGTRPWFEFQPSLLPSSDWYSSPSLLTPCIKGTFLSEFRLGLALMQSGVSEFSCNAIELIALEDSLASVDSSIFPRLMVSCACLLLVPGNLSSFFSTQSWSSSSSLLTPPPWYSHRVLRILATGGSMYVDMTTCHLINLYGAGLYTRYNGLLCSQSVFLSSLLLNSCLLALQPGSKQMIR